MYHSDPRVCDLKNYYYFIIEIFAPSMDENVSYYYY